MDNEKKLNASAKDQIFKGVFRIPFAFLLGGPYGIIANMAYTAIKTKDEVDQHEAFLEKQKEWFDPHIVEKNRIKMMMDKKRAEDKLNDNIEYLKAEFADAEDESFKKVFSVNYCTKQKFTSVNGCYRASFVNGYGLFDGWSGEYLPEEKFVEKYKKDKANGKIIKLRKFYNNQIRATFGYHTEDDFYFTGMFTIIDE